MIPTDGMSASPVISSFLWPVRSPREKLVDYEQGGKALQDASLGLTLKTWTLNYNKATGDFTVSAPGVTETVVLNVPGVTRCALSFDQNMAPAIAYEVGGVPKLWWFDTSIPGYTTLTRSSSESWSYLTMDNKQELAVNLGQSDMLWFYVRGSNLYYRQQRDRFTVEYLLAPGVTKCYFVGMNKGWRLQIASNGSQAEPWYLGDVVLDLAGRVGLKPEFLNVDELYDDLVPGMKVEQETGVDEPMDWLRDMFYFDKSAHDRKLYFPKRGREPSAWIPYAHLLPGNPEALQQTLVDEGKLPREINLTHLDPAGGYAENKQTATRRSNLVHATKKLSIDSNLVLDAGVAADIALMKLKVAFAELINFKFSTTVRYSFLVTGDVVMVEDARGDWHRIRIEDRNEDSGAIEWTGPQDGGAHAYNRVGLIGNPLPPPVSTSPGLISTTRLEILNISPQKDQDDQLGLYVAGCGSSAAWTGYQLLYSIDGGVSYAKAFETSMTATIGDTVTDLEEDSGYFYPSSQTVGVLVNNPLASITYDQLLGRQNRAVIGDEVLQFQTATLIEMINGKYHYELSGLVRGRFGTDPVTWSAGARFVLIDGAVIFAQVQRAQLGTEIFYKAVSQGRSTDETTPVAYNFDEAISQTEWPVYDVATTRNGSDDVTVTWKVRMRLGFDNAPYHSQWFRGCRIKFSNGTIINVGVGTLSATYNSAPTGITVQVCAMNDITGEGPYSAAVST